jgi:signal transduction histidine kinase/ligand-binding sensor domain-containing protein
LRKRSDKNLLPGSGWIYALTLALLLSTSYSRAQSDAVALPPPGESLPGGILSQVGSRPEDQFAIETWKTENGLPQDIATALVQTRAGYIWIATYSGVARFDGLRFTVFDSANTPGLCNSRITSLFEDRHGSLWIGHDTGEISNFFDGVFRPVYIRTGWSGGTISGIGADPLGQVWALSLGGEVLRISDGLVLKPPHEMAADPSLVPQLVTDGQDRLLVVRNGRVAEVTSSELLPVNFQSKSAEPYYARIAAARAGGWWVATEGRVRRWADDHWQDDLGAFDNGAGFVVTMMESSSGQVFVGTLQNGIFFHDRRIGWTNLDRTSGLPGDWIRALVEDIEHNIWVGTSGGLAVLRPRSVVMCDPPDAWLGKTVQAITLATDNAVWAATEGAGLYRLSANGWERFAASAGLSNVFVWSVLQDSRGAVWAGTWGGGLFRWDGTRFAPEFDLAERGEPVTALLESPPGTLWIGTARGLLRLNEGKLLRLSRLGDAAAGDVRALVAGRHGKIWIGTQGSGLGCISAGKLRTFHKEDGLPTEFILSLYEEADETLWIGTLDRGICRFRNGRFDSITTQDGLPSNAIGHIEDDLLGNFWFSSQRGLFRISKRHLNDCAEGQTPNLQPLVFGKAEGLSSEAGSSGFAPSGFRSPDGRLWFPTAKGIAVVNPKAVRRNDVPPAVWIEELFVDGQRAQIKQASARSNQASTATPNGVVELMPGQRQLDIAFTGISLTSPDRVQFRYRLEGLDADWLEGGGRRRVTYPFLPPGNYVFRVMACNSDGLWNEAGDSIAIAVLPYPWQTWWFKSVIAVAGFSAVGLGVWLQARHRHRRKVERIRREHELERERARIAQDIHDDLGASLTRIGMLSQSAASDLHDTERTAAELNAIYTTARDLTLSMDEIVWAVNPRHDTLESLTNYVTRYAHDFLSAAHIRCRLDAAMEVPEITVHSEIRHNLFLAYKEVLNNAVKHSGASEIRVSLSVVRRELKLSVSDNGSGFPINRAAAAPGGNRLISGYGMSGIRNRLEQIGGRMELETMPGQGTRIDLFVPLPGVERLGSSNGIQFC